MTEAMGGGVLTLMETLSRRQCEQGADVSVWFIPRPETPSDAVLISNFDQRVELKRISGETSGLRRYAELFSSVRAAAASGDFDVIHLHSSKAGGVGRLAATSIRRRRSAIVYSPHGFAFLRQDTNGVVSKMTLLAEKVLSSLCDLLVLTSASEKRLAEEKLGLNTALLPTGVPEHLIRSSVRTARATADGRLRVGMVGRICYQKAPWRFATVARALSGRADFVWIGGGPQGDIARWIDDSGVNVTGWLNADELAQEIKELDVLLFPTLWEGMALSLMQAQAQGIPAVVSNVVGNVDSVVDGQTGFVCSDDDELIRKLLLLLTNDELRMRMADSAISWARKSLMDTNIGADSIAIYHSVSVEAAGA